MPSLRTLRRRVRTPRPRPRLAIAAVGLLVLSACSGGSGSGDGLTGEIIISGSSTVEPISSIVAEDFGALHPEVVYSVDGPGTGDGFALFCNGETDISDASRPIREEEEAACAEAGVEYVELKIAVDGISVLTSPSNDAIECLSFLDLYALLGPESQGFQRWSDANALADELSAELGDEFGPSHAPYPDTALDITGPGEESGTYDSFVELVLEDIAEARGTDPVVQPDYVASGDDNVIIEGISGSEGSLGWVGFAFFEESADVVRAIPIDGGSGCVEPTTDTIATNEYPIARDLYIYPNTFAAETIPAVEAFVDYYLSDAGMAVVEETGYVRLTPEALAETRATWEAR